MHIAFTVDINASPARIYEAITTPGGLAAWWTPGVTAKPEVGSVNEFRFTEMGLTFRVEQLVSDQRVVWSGVDVPDDWKGRHVTFEISQDGESATLEFRQGPFPANYEAFGTFSYHWGQYLRSLKMFVETGAGEPYGSPGSLIAGTTPT